jgi:predicted DNA-binding transcriptional regulator YafY
VLRSERLVKLLELLGSNAGIQASVLARECGVSERTLLRDLNALTEAGFPVYFDRGYRMAAPALLPAVTFTVDEALALGLAAKQVGRPTAGRVARALGIAAEKLQQALAAQPPERPPEQQMALTLPVRDPRADAVMGVFSDGIAAQHTVRVTWAPTARRRPGPERLDPYRLLAAETGPELLAYSHERRRILRIPLSHVREAVLTKKRFRPVAARLLERHLHHAPRAARSFLKIRFACRPPLAHTLQKHPPTGMLMWEDGPGGGIIFTLVALRSSDVLPWLLACSENLEVLEPASLRDEIARIGRDIAARHSPRPAPG